MLELYRNIRKYRVSAGMTQDELARRAGYTDRSSIAKIEKGIVDLPQSKIKQFADIFGVTPGTLMGWVSPEAGKKNSAIADAVKRMRSDESYLGCVEKLSYLSAEQLMAVDQLLVSMIHKQQKD